LPDQPLDAVLAQRLQHPVAAGFRRQLQDRSVHQGGQQLGDLGGRHRGAGAERGGRVRRDAAGQDGDPVGHRTFVLAQQIPAPGDDGAQRAVPDRGGAGAGRQQLEPVRQSVRQLGQ
jgi:hypothetical protein